MLRTRLDRWSRMATWMIATGVLLVVSSEVSNGQDRPLPQLPRLSNDGGTNLNDQSRKPQQDLTLPSLGQPAPGSTRPGNLGGSQTGNRAANGLPVQPVGNQQTGLEQRSSRQVIDGNRVHLRTSIVRVIEKIQVPAREAGVLDRLEVKEGQWVEGGTLIGLMDDQQAKTELESAEKRLDASQLKISSDIAIQYAQAASLTANKAYERERNLVTRGAGLASKLEELELAAIHGKLQLEKARHDYQVDQKAVVLDQLQVVKADQFLKRHEIIAPWNGVVTKILKRQSEWVNAGDPILEIAQMDRLWIESDIDPTSLLPYQVSGQSALVTLTLAAGEKVTFPGQIVYVDPEVVGDFYKVRAEVTNRQVQNHWLLIPGMYVDMELILAPIDPNAPRISHQ